MTFDSCQRLRTAAAAAYASRAGRQTSPSLLRKLRLKGTEDPGEKGPPWERAPNGDCLYPVSGLDVWIAEYLSALRPGLSAEPPRHLLGSRASTARKAAVA